MKLKKFIPLALVFTVLGGIIPSQTVSASNDYPTHTQTTDSNGITMTNAVAWNDETHTNGNYNANLDITINGLKEKKSFNEPIDVQIIHDISTSMDHQCFADNHVSFTYYKSLTKAISNDDMGTYKSLIENHLKDLLKTKKVTGKNDWISIAGMQDKDGYTFSDNAYLIPEKSFYLGNGWGGGACPTPGGCGSSTENDLITPSEFTSYYYIIDNPVSSKDVPIDPKGYAYWVNSYHAGMDETGKYYSLSITPDPERPTSIFFFLSREGMVKNGCKSYTTTANKLMSDFGNTLYSANIDNHLSITSFAENSRWTSSFTDNSTQFSNDIITAFNQEAGQTNYEAGLVAGSNNLSNHNDDDNRKKYIIFISDGQPNRSLDEAGSIVESSNMTRLIQIADKIKEDGTEIYTIGFCIDESVNNTYLLPIATDKDHSLFRTPDQLDKMVEVYDLIQKRVIEDTYIKSTVENTISKYYTVDKDNLSSDVTLIEEEQILDDGTTRTIQKIRYNVKTEDLDNNGINTKSIPLILKEEYRNTDEYYPTNDEEINGANAIYENLDATKQNIAVETPWLSVNTKEEKTYKIDTEVINGTISEDITGIKTGETKEISYAPKNGYVLDSITVDGKNVDINKYKDIYKFENIDQDHVIKVTYKIEQTYNIVTEAVNGTISESITGIKHGEEKEISYSPSIGYVLEFIIVDGKKIDIAKFKDTYKFENIDKDHTIKVIYKKEQTYKINTEAINGSISESITDIKAGENKEIIYSPDKGYILDYIEVDGKKIDITSFGSSYSFENINSDHSIKVVYKAQEIEVPVTPETPDTPDNPDQPIINNTQTPSQPSGSVQTGDNTKVNGYLSIVLVTGIFIVFKFIERAKKKAK